MSIQLKFNIQFKKEKQGAQDRPEEVYTLHSALPADSPPPKPQVP